MTSSKSRFTGGEFPSGARSRTKPELPEGSSSTIHARSPSCCPDFVLRIRKTPAHSGRRICSPASTRSAIRFNAGIETRNATRNGQKVVIIEKRQHREHPDHERREAKNGSLVGTYLYVGLPGDTKSDRRRQGDQRVEHRRDIVGDANVVSAMIRNRNRRDRRRDPESPLRQSMTMTTNAPREIAGDRDEGNARKHRRLRTQDRQCRRGNRKQSHNVAAGGDV